MTESLSDLWDQLERTSGPPGVVYRRLHPESRQDLRAELDRTSGARVLRFDRIWQPTDELPELVQSRAVRTEAHRNPQGTRMSFSITLADPAFTDVFGVLAGDVAAAVATAGDDRQATDAFFEQLERWRTLLEVLHDNGLSGSFRRGLFAELHLLGGVVLGALEARAAVEGWTGPLRAHQDFQFPSCAVEVKSTVGRQPQTFTVSSERELDETAAGRLYLFHVSIDERRGGEGLSLNTAVENVSNAVSADAAARALLQDRLVHYGYHQHQRHLYDEPRYSVRETSLYRVVDNFPRITEGSLIEGVGAVRYDVAVAACVPWRVDDAELATDLRRRSGDRNA